MGVIGRKTTAQTEELASDQDTRQISASQLAEVLAKVDGDRKSDASERGEGRISGARRISDLKPNEKEIAPSAEIRITESASVPAPRREANVVASAPAPVAPPIADSSANVRLVTAHQDTRAMTIALVLAVATLFATIVLAYRY